MKKTYLTITLSLLILGMSAQFKWANRGGSWAYDYGYGVTSDASGNVYVAGKYELNEAKFSNTYTVPCAGNHDGFLAKYDNAGALQWVKTAGGPDGDYWWGVSCDKTNNNLYVCGELEGGGTFAFPGSTVTLTGAGDNDVVFAKYDLNGNLIWAKREGVAATSEKALAVTHDNSGNVYICGYFTANTNFNNQPVTGYGLRDIYVAKYNSSGVFQWIQKAGGTGRDEARSIKCDNSGNLYVCGLFSGAAAFGSNNLTTKDAFYDAFLMKMSTSDGSIQWVKQGDAVLDDVAWSLVLDNTGNIYTSGEFNSWIDWKTPSSGGVATSGTTDMFVTKFDNSGNVVWNRKAGGTMRDIARGSGTDGTNIYFTGQFGGTAVFGTYSVTADDSSDVFIASIDANGTWRWAAEGDGNANKTPDTYEPLGYESGIAIHADAGNVIATGGMLCDTLESNPVGINFGGLVLHSYRRTDMFVVAIANTGVGIAGNRILEDIGIFPNPTSGNIIMDFKKVTGSLDVKIYNTMGQLVQAGTHEAQSDVQLDLGLNKDGIYLLEVKTEDNAVLRKKIILQH